MSQRFRGGWFGLTAVGLLLLGGCGTREDAPPVAEADPQELAPVQPSDAPPDAELVTPQQLVDTEGLARVVEAEVKGGEARRGPTDESYYWQPSDEILIEDEPLEFEVPLGLPPLTPVAVVPASNPITKGKYELGHQLYFDPRLSLNGTVSCATCHDPEKGWTDHRPSSIGIEGQVGDRNAPTVINTVYGKSMFWDGRAPSLEAQAQGPVQNLIEMGDQSYEEIVQRLRQIPGYQEQFAKVFGTEVTLDGIAKAIATFERVAALSGNSKYDQYLGGRGVDPDLDALSESEKRGMVLFGLRLDRDDPFEPGVQFQKALCSTCHVGANFTDEQFHNLGVGYDPTTGEYNDPGRFKVTAIGAKDPADIGAFKTPTLRDIEHTAPYMHDGSEATLEAVMELYDRGGNPNPYLDPEMKPLNLTEQETADVIAFMKALSGDRQPVELPALPPNSDGSSPNPADALRTPTKSTAALEVDPHLFR